MPAPEPRLSHRTPVASPRAVALLLHGGRPRSLRPVDGRSASYRRAAALRDGIAPGLLAQDVAVCLLRFGVRGWNAGSSGGPSPVVDTRWALDQLATAYPGAPIVLLGHSMGARAAVHVAQSPQVHGVVALAPWWEAGDPVRGLAGKRLTALHGSRDRITSATATREFVERASREGAAAEFIDMGPVGHYLLQNVRAWNQRSRDAVLAALESESGENDPNREGPDHQHA